MKKKISKEIEIDLPSLPNFLRSKDGHSAIHISEFSKKELQTIGELWTVALIKRAKK